LWQLPKRVAACFLIANVAQIKALTVTETHSRVPNSALLPVDFQIDHHFLAVVESGHIAHRRFCSLEVGVHLIVSIRIEAGETVIPFSVSKIAADRVGPEVFQEYHAVWQRIFGFIGDDAVDRAQLCFLLGILGGGSEYEEEKEGENTGQGSRVFHFGSPAFAGLLLSSLNVKRF